MPDIIQLLPDSVANQIAAGEVIQRPASVVKELMENALDAGAHEIHVMITDAGRTAIKVVDDGCGMSATDARLAFERHATSKIRKASDLFDLHTMGFRGEALPSIAAVAQVTLTTRTQNDEVGTSVTIHGSRFQGQEPVACPQGSQFLVENLFYNVPARRKFLKSNSTELSNILTAYERIVLVYPSVAFTLHSNGTEISNLPAAGLRQRIIDVFGRKLNQDLLPVSVETSLCTISGFVGKPESARKKGAHQFFFANGRYMRHTYFAKAVMAPFERLIPQGEQVPYFLYIDVDPADVDVNIHPTKTEIKFENEQAIWQMLMAAVKDAVGKFSEVPYIDFDTVGKPDFPIAGGDTASGMPVVRTNPQYNPFNETRAKRTAPVDKHWEDLFPKQDLSDEQQPGLFDQEEENVETAADIIAEKSPSHYQYKGRYIMTAVKSGLMIIDQHRAHLRVLYEEYLEKMKNHKWHSQTMLFPEIVRFSPTQANVVNTIMTQLTEAGFNISDLGGGSFAIEGVPVGIENIDTNAFLHEIVTSAEEHLAQPAADMEERLALNLARAAAIPYGQVLANEEMENVVNRLFSCSNVNMTPDGRSILCILQQQEIEHLLG